MKQVNMEDLRKGDLILVRWFDASELRAKLNQHEQPEVAVWEWGIFLGLRGRKRKHLLLGKDLVQGWDEWGAARIPAALIDTIILLDPQSFQKTFKTGTLRKIKLRTSRHRITVKM
ncbi:MAG: hypothetical protein OEZ48_01335 [Candidatus Bathyarchaeota archaeon]|nr:hypothetical protein [Candidatus Bathyarchaeota archaeon]MDH5686502.1 hypothetical protein [Candidatus Bathyarchaeota archaeon]